MIDRNKREVAAVLLHQFLEGEITSDDLEARWPTSKIDRALEAVSSMVWRFYDDFRPRRMIGKDEASPEERALLTRYAAFLGSHIEYDWPEANFIRLSGLGALVPLSLGLLAPIDRWIKARNARIDTAMAAHGDIDAWPFTRAEQWDDHAVR